MDYKKSLPRYKTHKQLWAVQIETVSVYESSGGANLIPLDKKYDPIVVNKEYVTKYKPYSGGYFIDYGGKKYSFSSPLFFEEGFTLVTAPFYIEQLVIEHSELTEKIEKLKQKLDDNDFLQACGKDYYEVISAQYEIMIAYQQILDARIQITKLN